MSGSVDLIRSRVTKASASPLAAPSVTLIGASKHQSAEVIESTINAGLTHFGENIVQEASAKWPALRARYPNITLHLIGPLQTNKVRQAVELFDTIHSLDRINLAEALVKEMEHVNRRLPCFIQVNTGNEPQKSGVALGEADAFISQCIHTYKLPIVGLMCVPPVDQPPAPHFALLRHIAHQHGLRDLSMGMSDDFETAVRMGATYVRVGRALFGERN